MFSGGSAGNSTDTLVSSNKWFDPDGRLIKEIGPTIVKYAYDHQGRRITT